MSPQNFATELNLYGPRAKGKGQIAPAEASEYCRRLARGHYENFSVASWLLPKQLQQHFYNIYAYCRWADDLADETGSDTQSLQLLDWWQGQLDACYRGRAEHPVLIALTDTIELFQIPPEPFTDLLVAFRQDQRKKRYETFDELLDYCRNSANPVGRLVLYLGRCHSEENVRLSDSVCTGLQLANFWQDVARDFVAGRIYLPQESCRRFGYGEAMFEGRQCNEAFREMLAFEVERAEQYLLSGLPLVSRVSDELRIEVDLFIRGGLAILQAIQRQQYDVWSRRPTVGKLRKLELLLASWWKSRGRT